jgi:hypothetical protein
MNKEIYNNNSINNTQQTPDSKTPCQHSWSSIYNNFHPVRRLPSITICIILASFLFFTGYINSKNSTEIIRPTQTGISGNQHDKTTTSLTTELPLDKQGNNVHQRTFTQMTILSDN